MSPSPRSPSLNTWSTHTQYLPLPLSPKKSRRLLVTQSPPHQMPRLKFWVVSHRIVPMGSSRPLLSVWWHHCDVFMKKHISNANMGYIILFNIEYVIGCRSYIYYIIIFDIICRYIVIIYPKKYSYINCIKCSVKTPPSLSFSLARSLSIYLYLYIILGFVLWIFILFV